MKREVFFFLKIVRMLSILKAFWKMSPVTPENQVNPLTRVQKSQLPQLPKNQGRSQGQGHVTKKYHIVLLESIVWYTIYNLSDRASWWYDSDEIGDDTCRGISDHDTGIISSYRIAQASTSLEGGSESSSSVEWRYSENLGIICTLWPGSFLHISLNRIFTTRQPESTAMTVSTGSGYTFFFCLFF